MNKKYMFALIGGLIVGMNSQSWSEFIGAIVGLYLLITIFITFPKKIIGKLQHKEVKNV